MTHKAREERIRRMAEHQGLRLEKSHRRDPEAQDYGEIYIDSEHGTRLETFHNLDDVEAWLANPERRR
jgi:hypothetical protein